MNYPPFSYAAAATSTLSAPDGHDAFVMSNSLTDRVRMFTNYIDEDSEKDLYNFFIEIIYEMFGRGSTKGWTLDKITARANNDQNYMCLESDCIYNFLCSNGHMFKLCYNLIANSSHKFYVYFTDIPVELKQKIEKSYVNSFYSSRFLYHMDSNAPIGLCLNSFEYYMFHFVLYGLKLTSDDIIIVNDDSSEHSVYVMLCLEYFNSFLPSSSTVLPELQFNVLSTISNKTQCKSPRKLFNFIKKDVACNEFPNNKVENSWIFTSEATWRTELVAFLFADLWLSCNTFNMASIILTKLIRCFIKQLHLYSNQNVTHNLNLIGRHGIQIYQYLKHYMDTWQQDFSFRYFLENWLCYIQPWRYDYFDTKHLVTEHEINEKWKFFIVRNLPCYTKLFSIVIKRFLSIDICSPRYSFMVLRVLKVFNHPHLLKIILDVEHMYLTNEPQYKKWNNLLSECLMTVEGPMFKYEPMFSENRSREYKLFFTKLQKSISLTDFELSRFQENNVYRDNSFLELILSPRINKISDYTRPEWEEIQTNLRSSLIFMEQIINVNVNITPKYDSFEWSISSVGDTSNIFNKSSSLTFERNVSNLSSKKNEWEIDPDYLATLPFENYFLVKLSKYLRSVIECYWNSYVLKFSVENTVLAGVLRQAMIRPPMKIYSYEARFGSKKRVRTPKIVPPTISFRWIASYFTLTWILFLLTLIWAFKNSGLWICLFFVFRIIYWCIKYLMGYAPPFKWEDFHEE